ncbi:MAG: hypothetical protein VX527_02235 [Planctomycetota bacterium]|nr:hypothetical protein [Planctomycetota bacterium]
MNGTPTVQLRHELPDGQWHVDWMLARDATSPLVTIRLNDRLDQLEKGLTVLGNFLGEHRRRYLTYEGPLTDGRGEVRQIASGHLLDWVCDGDKWWITVQWDNGLRQQLQVHIEGDPPPTDGTCQIYCVESSGDGGSDSIRSR